MFTDEGPGTLATSVSTGPRKRRTREHVIADLSVNHVERFVLRCGWTTERTRHDYAWRRELMPVILILYDASEDTAYWLHVQPYFGGRPRARRQAGATTTIQVPIHQVL